MLADSTARKTLCPLPLLAICRRDLSGLRLSQRSFPDSRSSRDCHCALGVPAEEPPRWSSVLSSISMALTPSSGFRPWGVVTQKPCFSLHEVHHIRRLLDRPSFSPPTSQPVWALLIRMDGMPGLSQHWPCFLFPFTYPYVHLFIPSENMYWVPGTFLGALGSTSK